eukprot:m.87060 g.87060  ORF g.87060 m.87060 type:complete len:200 (+) comp50953_c0_seq19:275-874(+)
MMRFWLHECDDLIRFASQSQLKHLGQDKIKVLIHISTSAVKLFERDATTLRDTHKLSNIAFVATLATDKKIFGFISVVDRSWPHRFRCHVFKCDSSSKPIVDDIGRCFTIAVERKREYDSYRPIDLPITRIRDFIFDNNNIGMLFGCNESHSELEVPRRPSQSTQGIHSLLPLLPTNRSLRSPLGIGKASVHESRLGWP